MQCNLHDIKHQEAPGQDGKGDGLPARQCSLLYPRPSRKLLLGLK
jgi:hypothetical protein